VIDRRADDPRTGLFSERLVRVVRDVVAAPEGRVVCVVNRTGRVRLLGCAACGELARCETCGAALEMVGDPARGARRVAPDPATERDPSPPRLRCRRCGEERPVVCARCGATRMKALRIGVSRVREELEALAGVAVAEVWGPAAADEGEEDRVRRARVVVGTEAALHRVPDARAVAFLEFDSELLAPRFRAAEQALALLARAARLVASSAGAGAGVGASNRAPDRAPGRVVVQTRQPRHPALVAAVSADPGVLAAAEAEVRRALVLPPFSALAVVSGAAADAYGRALQEHAPQEVEVSGPVEGVWSVRAPAHDQLCDLLAGVARPAGRLRVEVDPVRS
jgi:primosomal protein N' (replication factor Y)